MKSKIMDFIKIPIFCLVFIIGLNSLYQVFRWKDTSGNYESSFDSLQTLEKNTADVIFLGPSFTYSSMNPATFWEEYGIASFNMSVSAQDKSSTIACLKETLRTQSPKVVMIDASGILFDVHAVRSNVYRNTIGMPLSYHNYEHIKRYVGQEELLTFMLRWPIVHTRYKELTRYDFEQYEPAVYLMGYSYNFNVCSRPDIKETYVFEETTPISEINKAWADELIELSEKNGFTLVFYLTPGATDKRNIVDGFRDYVDSCGIDFLDLNLSELVYDLDYKTDFFDGTHLNYWGACKTQEYVAEYLLSKFELDDCRERDGYDVWKLSSKYKEHALLDRELGYEEDSYVLLERAFESEDIITIISVEGDPSLFEGDLYGALDACGVADLCDFGGTCVIENGSVLYMSTEPGEYRIKVNNADTLEIFRIDDSAGDYTLAFVGRNSLRNGSNGYINGMFVTMYDRFTNKVICEKYYR